MSGYGLRRVQALWPIAAAGLLLVLLPAVARADNCASIGDCFGGLQAAMTAAGAAMGAMVGVMLGGLGGFSHFLRGGYPDLPPNLAGPGQYGPYGNPWTGTDHEGNPYSGFYTGMRNDGTVGPVTPSHFTDPATGKDYVNSASGMIYFSQGVQAAANAIIPPERGSSGNAGGKDWNPW